MQSLQQYAGAPHNHGTLALVFTDIVGSTELNNHFGDDEWLCLLLQHFSRAKTLIDEHHGYLIKFIGDSCMVAFRSPVDAFHFCINFFVDTGHEFISIRAGFHFGSVLIVDDDVYGSMVNLTARIQHSVESSGIAISDPAFRDVRSVLGRSAPAMGEKATRPPLSGFPPQIVWLIATEEMRHADLKRLKARGRAQVPQPRRPMVPVRPASNQLGADKASPASLITRPRYNPPTSGDKK
jgi:class 3 adenylate cyclase